MAPLHIKCLVLAGKASFYKLISANKLLESVKCTSLDLHANQIQI